ncbi:uncharacterized protein [Misgurnus anguillicaudatus]|uniref:uncharacterized protein isoform X2 n=1 Tax=Misgurnus anguillicaudatus TaxID=75329 RepID=UPI003CCFA0E3
MQSMREINLETYSLSLLTAKEDILNPRSSTNWALFAYDGIMNRLKLADSGVGGLNELMTKLHPRRSLYGMCRVGTNQSHIVMILWVGNEVDEYRKAECASHLPAIRAFFREVQIFLPAHTLDEITEERICTLACKAATVMQGPRQRHVLRREDRQEAVGTNYRRTIASAEILRIQRDSFWAQAEREEDERKKEEQRRAAEDRRKREKERLLHERRQAEERERKMMEREQRIKEQRRIQAQMEAEQHRQDRLKWDDQVREREEEERTARYSNSESKEKATEAAALVSQRTSNPRDFFRQLSSSNSQPSSPFPVRSPHRTLHSSPTDNVFIFNELSSSTPPSPYRSTVASPYRPLTPTSKSPTLVFPNSATSLWHSPVTASSSHLEQNPPQNSAMLSSRSQIHPSSPQLTESSYKDTVDHTQPPSSLKLQTQPPTVTDTLQSEINTPIMAILDSLVFYPPPPTTDLDNEGSYEAKTTAELPSPPSGFELSPKHSEVLLISDFDLDSQSISDSSVCTPGALLSSPPQCSPVSLVPSCLPVLQPPSRPLPDLPVTPQTVKDLNLKRDFTALSSIISTVEEEELEEEDGERNQKEWIQEEQETEIKDEEDKVVEERHGVRGYEEEGGEERVENRDESEEINAGQEEPDGKMMKKDDSEKEHNKKIVEEIKSENIQDEKNFEKEKKQHGEIMEECEKEQHEKVMGEDKNEKYQDEKIVEESESEKYQDGKMVEECKREKSEDDKIVDKSESEKYQDGKMVEECKREKSEDDKIVDKSESEKYQDDNILEQSQSEKLQDGKIVEESESEKYQDEKIVEESESEKYQDDKIVDKSESEKYQDDNILEGSQSEKLQHDKISEEFECEKYQDGKVVEECKREKFEDDRILDKSESEKYQDDNILEGSQSEKLQDGKIVEESESEKYQDDNILEQSQSKKLQDGKIVEECKRDIFEDYEMIEKSESKKYQDDKILEESQGEKPQDDKIVDKSESEKYQDDKILEESQSEKLQDGKIVEESQSEKLQDGKIVEECKREKFEDDKIVDKSDSEKYQDDKILEGSQSEKLQDEKIVDECKRKKLQDYKIVDKSESEKYQDEKSVEECKREKIEDDKIIEESKSEKYQDEKIVKESESEKYQDDKILEESESEKLQDGKIVEEDNTEKEHDEEMIETCASNEDQKDKEYYQDEYEQSLMNQESGEKSNVDFNSAKNLTVLKVESDTEIIMNYDATDEQGVEKLNSVKLNKNEERNTTFMIKDEALETEYQPTVDKQNDRESCIETHFSQQTPLFPESSTTGIGQYSHRSLPESISHNKNEPRMSTDLQTLSSWSDSQTLTNDSLTAISFSQACLQNHTGSEENHITLSQPTSEQSCTTEHITSAIPQSQASTAQSDGEEGLETVNHFIKDLDTSRCISDQSQQGLTNENTNDDGEEEEEAATVTASDGSQDSKCDSAPEYPNEAQQCEISLNSRDIRKLQKTDEPLTSQRGSEELSRKIGDISTLMSSEIDVAMETDHHS